MYELEEWKEPGAELISDGPMPVYSHRTVWEPNIEKPILTGGVSLCFPCQDIAYLAQMGGVPSGRVESAAYGSTAVRWTDPAQMRAAILRAIADQESALQQLATALIATGALQLQTGLTLHIGIEIEDGRGNRSVPLPSIDPTVEFPLH